MSGIPESTRRHLDNAERRISLTLERMEIGEQVLKEQYERISEKYSIAPSVSGKK